MPDFDELRKDIMEQVRYGLITEEEAKRLLERIAEQEAAEKGGK